MEILCTLGPATFNEQHIKKLTQLGVSLFRINLSHTKIEELEGLINFIRKNSDVPICLDSEGAQIRTGDFEALSYQLNESDEIEIPRTKVLGGQKKFNLYPLEIIDQFQVGDLVSIDFNSVLAKVSKKATDSICLKIINGGVVGRNKAVSLDRNIELPPLTEKDILAMEVGKRMNVKDVALSFANKKEDVHVIRNACLPGARIISKIECLNALNNLDGILEASDAILIDRGDLSREVQIETVPFFQKEIIKRGKKFNKKVYVATNLLESMVQAPMPTRAEVNDIYNTIIDGAAGLVLAAETAIGKYPIECVAMVKSVFLNSFSNLSIEEKMKQAKDILIDPHGGQLIQSFEMLAATEISKLPQMQADYESLLDFEQLAHGTFSPLTGFMGKFELESVLKNNRLRSGLTWTLPVVFQASDIQLSQIKKNSSVVILDLSGKPHSLFKIKDVYQVNFDEIILPWFGSTDRNHPGIKKLVQKGNVFVEGDVFLLDSGTYQNKELSFSPRKIRNIFQKKGWREVVGFHSRNIPHKAHEFIQLESLKLTHADGLLISPVVGPKKNGDFLEDIVFESYELAIKNNYFPKSKTFLSGFNSYSRFAGPREAVFTAICRQNMGCNYFIVGRDHTGVGKYYLPYASQELFGKMDNLMIKPINFNEIAFNPRSSVFEEVRADQEYYRVSGTEFRDLVNADQLAPDWFVRPEISKFIQGQKLIGRKLFFE